MSSNSEPEFLSLAPLNLASDDDTNSSPISSIRPHLDTLFAEFSRTQRSRASRSPPTRIRRTQPSSNLLLFSTPASSGGTLDLRSLEYVSEYDSHLMCPICHIPFISPIVLECDHTFCTSCYDQYRDGTTIVQQDQCPTCRLELDNGPRKASRLITNMCNDLKVRCPNEECGQVLPRGCIELHISKDCQEQKLSCPETACTRLVKRKNFQERRCIHSSHFECDCGDLIELGRGDSLRHKDMDCPMTGMKCDKCGERMSRTQTPTLSPHICHENLTKCPGAEFGCDEHLDAVDLEAHSLHCPMALLAPFLQKQSRVIATLQERLTQAQVRNDILENGLTRTQDLIRLRLSTQSNTTSSSSSIIEEIERSQQTPGLRLDNTTNSVLTLPAHLRDLTPSPSLSATHVQNHNNNIATQTQLLLSQHESLRHDVNRFESDLATLAAGLEQLDGRTSMQIMNETLRIKEDLAHTNAALFSTRAQVQWMLNRDRTAHPPGETPNGGNGARGVNGPELVGGSYMARGRASVGGSGNANVSHNFTRATAATIASVNRSVEAGPSTNNPINPDRIDRSNPFAQVRAGASRVALGMDDHVYDFDPTINGTRASGSSTNTSPRLGGVGFGTRRQSGGAGGSQERVKL